MVVRSIFGLSDVIVTSGAVLAEAWRDSHCEILFSDPTDNSSCACRTLMASRTEVTLGMEQSSYHTEELAQNIQITVGP